MKLPRISAYLPALPVVGLSVAVTLWFALSRGQDFNWDQQNYHIGVPFLLQHGTFWSSIAPAGVQSFYNPTVIAAEYLAIRHFSPMGFAVILALAESIGMVFAGLICQDIARAARAEPREAAALGLLGFALCLMAPMVLSEAGATFTDFLTAVPVIAAFGLLLARGRLLRAPAAVALAGGLIGAATALKPTNAVFALGGLAFALAGPEPIGRRLRGLALYGIAAAGAFLAVGGWWYFVLWQRFGNPLFPYFNNIFRSPDFGDAAIRVERFRPHSVLDIWRYPLYWAFGGSPNPAVPSPSAEVAFADARWMLVAFAGTAFLAALAIFPAWRKERLADPATGLFFAVVLSYVVWLGEFAIQRYLVVADILCGAALLFLTLQIRWRFAHIAILTGSAALSLAVIVVPDWTHLPWRDRWQGIAAEPLRADGPALVFLTGKPSLYVAASLPADWRYVGAYGDIDLMSAADTSFARQLRQALSASPTLKEIDRGSVPAPAQAILASYGLAATTACQKLEMPDATFRICDVARAP